MLFLNKSQFTKLRVHLHLALSLQLKIIKRTMWGQYHNVGEKALLALNKNYGLRYYAKHSVHKPTVMRTNHEENQENQKNPILTKTNKQGVKKPLQHYPVTKTICDKPGCVNLMCPNLCGHLVETRAVGHGTHSKEVPGKQVRPISYTDFNNQPREQYMVYYTDRPVSDLSEDTVDEGSTKKLTEEYQIYEKFFDK